MPVDSQSFKDAMACFASGVTVVTARTPDGGDVGMTASAFSSLSLDPPLLLFCVKKGNSLDQTLATADAFAVSILAEGQSQLSTRFAGWGEKPADDVSDLDPPRGPLSGAAWLDGALCNIDCSVHQIIDGGDHHIVVGRVEAAQAPSDREGLAPLLYFCGAYRAAGDRL